MSSLPELSQESWYGPTVKLAHVNLLMIDHKFAFLIHQSNVL